MTRYSRLYLSNVSAKISRTEKTRIIEAVKNGDYLNVSDFVRQAIREKLEDKKK